VFKLYFHLYRTLIHIQYKASIIHSILQIRYLWTHHTGTICRWIPDTSGYLFLGYISNMYTIL